MNTNNSNFNQHSNFTTMNKNSKFTLAHYREMKQNGWNRICPQCGQKSLSPYIDRYKGTPVDDKTCGKCSHEHKCGYHQPPREWFAEHRPQYTERLPKEEFKAMCMQRRREEEEAKRLYLQREAERKARMLDPFRMEQHPDAQAYIDRMGELCEQSQSTDNDLARWLCTQFDKDKVDEVLRFYRTGSTRDGWIVYWQIDIRERVHAGKLMPYGSDGHRIKSKNANWAHAKDGIEQLAEQCLFGEHRLMGWEDTIALVESEKTALIMAIKFPNILWLATGGKQNFKHEVLWPLCGHNVFVLPDADAIDEWAEKIEVLNRENPLPGEEDKGYGYRLIIPDVYRDMCTTEAIAKKMDIADMMLEGI